MGQVHYFSGLQKLVTGFSAMPKADFAAKFPGVKGVKFDGYQMQVAKNEAGEVLPVTRVIFRKANPSNHKCDARCRHAKGGNCECSCGGQFHGAGA